MAIFQKLILELKSISVEELLKDKEIEIILNLTIPGAHYEVSKMALENEKHSYAEKPMAVNFDDGKKLVELAKEKNLYIGNAPDTFLGGGTTIIACKNTNRKLIGCEISKEYYDKIKLI